MGKRNRPFYRIGVFDNRTRRDGSAIELLGWYDPLAPDENKRHSLKPQRTKHWIANGALPSDTVRSIMRNYKIEMPQKAKKKKKKPAKK